MLQRGELPNAKSAAAKGGVVVSADVHNDILQESAVRADLGACLGAGSSEGAYQ